MKTIKQQRIEEMQAKGYQLIAETSGTFTFAKGSNLMRKLEALGVKATEVQVVCGARAGARQNDGYQLLIFKMGE